MYVEHPIIAVTDSSGARASKVREAFVFIFTNAGVTPVAIEGDSFHIFLMTSVSAL